MVTPRQYPAELEETFAEEYTFVCPMRGVVTQLVMVNKYKPLDRRLRLGEEEQDVPTK